MNQNPARILAFCAGATFAAAAAMAAPPDADAVSKSLAHFRAQGRAYGLGDPSRELSARSSSRDTRGATHVRFDQLYKGVRVFEGEAISHVDRNGRVTVTDALRRIDGLSVTPALSADEARAMAVNEVRAQGAHSVTGNRLEVLPRGARSDADRLVWHVTVAVENSYEEPAQRELFYDAHSGSLVFAYDNLQTGKPGGGGSGTAASGTAKTMYVGDKAIGVSVSGGTYSMADPTRSGNYTCDQGNKQGGPCNAITRSTPVFGNNLKDASDRATAGADAHFGLQQTWDYYKATFGRNGIDGAGRQTYSRVHYGSNYQNAFWSDSCFCMTYGDGGSTFYPLVSIDVAGHEMSHGVMASEADLTYSGESGGLNESNSDIFGTMVEYAANSTADPGDYWIGERIYRSNWSGSNYTQSKALRYMNDPAKDGASPACWSSSLGSLDVHYSSGPNNHMFYLLAEGGASKCNGQNVNGVGRDKAARIWYRAVTTYLTSGSGYHDARVAALAAAADLYGSGSAEQGAVAAAYSAINVQ